METPAASEHATKGKEALLAGQHARAREELVLAVAAHPDDVEALMGLATAEAALGNAPGEIAAIERALSIQPRNFAILLRKGAHFETQGDARLAAQIYSDALKVAPPFHQVPPHLKDRVRHAAELSARYRDEFESFVREKLSSAYDLGSNDARRFANSVDVLFGKKAVYRPQPHNYYIPELPPYQFFERRDCPWLDAVEAETESIRSEMLAILAADEGLVPYVDNPASAPLDQWAELNHNPRWSVYHLWLRGQPIPEHCARAPKTCEVMDLAPRAQLPQRSPVGMYSILKPHTRIPPHTGIVNVRLVCHVPLVIPDRCWFRVGNETRPWRIGEAFVFDDTIEHEAANDSDEIRVVLIFDVWNPYVREDERPLIGALMSAIDEFSGLPPADY